MSKAVAIIVAAGRGERAGGGVAKQWRPLHGKYVVDWSIGAFRSHPAIRSIVLVVGEDIPPGFAPEGVTVVRGGASRSASVLNGLRAIEGAGDDAAVLIHDAARPGLSPEIIDGVLAALETADAAAPALPVQDALKRQDDAGFTDVDREGLYRVQTPQAFRLGMIRTALEDSGNCFVDDLAAVEERGAKVSLTQGTLRLSKITYPEDFDMVARILAPSGLMRVGKGFDVHAFEPGDHVTLCGVAIPHTARLKGHSDADAAWHALTDAILGAAALGDIGDHFPPGDPDWKDADSALFLREAQRIAAEAGYTVTSCDITIICEAPKVKPHRDAMRARTADILRLPLDAVSVKATTTEGLGFTGRSEGIAAEAIAVLARN